MSYQRAKELRERRKKLSEQAAALLPEGDERMAPEAEQQFDQIHDDIEKLDGQIARVERQMDREHELREDEYRARQSRGVVAGRKDSDEADAEDGSEEQREATPEELREARLAYLRGRCTPEQRSLLTPALDLPDEVRAMASGSDTAGGILIQGEPAKALVEARMKFGGMRRARTTKTVTSHGREIPIPTFNGTKRKGRRLGEGRSAKEVELKFGASRLNAYTYTSDYILVPFQLQQDTEYDLEGFIFRTGGEAIERIFNEECTLFDGAGGPQGIVPAAKQAVTGSKQTAIEYDEFVDIESEVDEAYTENAEWMANRFSIRQAKKIKTTDGVPLWNAGLAVREPNTILNYPYVANSDIAKMGAGAVSWLFGDFSNYHIRDVNPPVILKLKEKFAEEGHVAYLIFQRHDGKYVNAGTDPIVAFKNKA